MGTPGPQTQRGYCRGLHHLSTPSPEPPCAPWQSLLIPQGLLQADARGGEEETRACRISSTALAMRSTALPEATGTLQFILCLLAGSPQLLPGPGQPGWAPAEVSLLREGWVRGKAGCATQPGAWMPAPTCFIYSEGSCASLRPCRLPGMREVQKERAPLVQGAGGENPSGSSLVVVHRPGGAADPNPRSEACRAQTLCVSQRFRGASARGNARRERAPEPGERRGKQQQAATSGPRTGSRGNGGEHPARPRPSALRCIFSLTCNTVLLSQTMSVFDQFLYPRHRRSERPRPDGSYCRRLPALPLLPSPPPPAR